MNIFVRAYLDKNLGDDIMLYKFAEYMAVNRPCAVLYVQCDTRYTGHYEALLSSFGNIKLIQDNLRSIKAYGKSFFSFVVLLGGSVLQGRRYVGCWYRFLNCIVLDRLKRHGTAYAIIGCNTGPFNNRFMEYFVKMELRRACLITTRDSASFKYIKAVAKNADVYRFSDILFGLSGDIAHTSNTGRSGLGVAVHGPSKENYLPFLARLCDEYIASTKTCVKFFCFDDGDQDDALTAKLVCELMAHKSDTSIIKHNAQWLKTVEEMQGCDRIIAIRFHAAIIASLLSIPFITFSYSIKTRNFMEDTGNPESDFPVDSLNNMPIQACLDKILTAPVRVPGSFGEDSHKHFEVFNAHCDAHRRQA